MDMKRWAKRNPTEAIVIGLGIVVALCNLGGVKDMMARQNAQRAIVASNQDQVQSALLLQDKQKELAKIANDGYDAGCQMVLSLDVAGHYKALSIGSPVLDGNTAARFRNVPLDKLPLSAVLPAGSAVCDAYGNYAVLQNNTDGFPVVLTIATTTDQARIGKAMERVKALRSEALK